MKTFTMTNIIPAKTYGDTREWSLAAHMGVNRSTHDSGAYDKGSDVEAGEMLISVKTSAFTLMSGSLCEGLETYNDIWNLYMERTHSNLWAYITADYQVYMMNRDEFTAFCSEFCKTERESQKNGGAMKIRCKKESKKMLAWLAAHVG